MGIPVKGVDFPAKNGQMVTDGSSALHDVKNMLTKCVYSCTYKISPIPTI